MELLRQPECPLSHAWLESGIEEFLDRMALQTPVASPLPLPAISAGRVLVNALLNAQQTEALQLAVSLQDGEHWAFAAAEAARQLRRDWQEGRVDMDAAAQAYGVLRSMLIYNGAEPSAASEPKVLLFVPEREVHTVGAEILAAKLRCAGSEVELLLQVPEADVLERLSSMRFDTLGVSLGSDPSLLGMADFIAQAKAESADHAMRIVVGGQAFSDTPTEYDFLGADTVCPIDQDPLIGFAGLTAVAQKRSKGLV